MSILCRYGVISQIILLHKSTDGIHIMVMKTDNSMTGTEKFLDFFFRHETIGDNLSAHKCLLKTTDLIIDKMCGSTNSVTV